MDLIDTHCHLDFAAFDLDREPILDACRQAGIGTIVVPGVSAAAWDRQLALCASHPELQPALGLHPVFLEQHAPDHVQRLAQRLATAQPIAIGEIGLDFQLRHLNRELQTELLRAQLGVAASAGLPVLLHVRKAHDEVLALLRRTPVPGGIIHAFNGSLQQGRHYIAMGFCLGFGGMLTFERSRKLRDLARRLPLDALVLETDAPDMTVVAHRGERNSPEYLPDIATALGEVRGIPVQEVAASTTANARRVLGLPSP